MASPVLPPHAMKPWRRWYDNKHWRRRRRLQLNAHPLCEECLRRGVTTPATIADHVRSHRGNWNAFLTSALQSLCKRCHDTKQERALGLRPQWGLDDDGWPLDPSYRVNRREAHDQEGVAKPLKDKAKNVFLFENKTELDDSDSDSDHDC